MLASDLPIYNLLDRFRSINLQTLYIYFMEIWELCYLCRNLLTVTHNPLFLHVCDAQYSKCPNSISSLAFNRDGRLLAIASSSTFEESDES